MLCEAMEQLLAEKPYGEISVSEICELSTVQRGTFYRHFEDKAAFFRHYLNTITERLLAEAEAEGGQMDELEPYARAMILKLIDFVQSDSRFVQHTIGSNADANIIDMAVVQVAKGVTERARKQVESGEYTLSMPPEFLGRFYAGGMIQVLRWWLLDKPDVSREELERCTNEILLACFEKTQLHNA